MSDAHADAESVPPPLPPGQPDDHSTVVGVAATTLLLVAAGAAAVTTAPTPAAAAMVSATFLLAGAAIALARPLLATMERARRQITGLVAAPKRCCLPGTAICVWDRQSDQQIRSNR